MYLDAQLLFSDAQALTATAASTNIIDLGIARGLGAGKAMMCVILADVALAGTTPTLVATLQCDDNSAFSSATTVAVSSSYSTLAAGGKIELPIPQGFAVERYLRVNYTLGGTTPTTTVTAFLTPAELVDNVRTYADAVTIS